MNSVESYRRVANAERDPFSMVLSTVNADYDQLRRKAKLELPQLREYMNAVNSPIGPEIEQHDFPSKIGKLECLSASVHPIDVIRKLRRPYRGRSSEFSWHLNRVLVSEFRVAQSALII